MIDDRSKLNDLAAAELAALEAKGVAVSPADVVMINALAWEVEKPRGRLGLSRGVPCMLCEGVHLWPLTLLGEYMMQGLDLAELSERDQTAVLAYCMAHGRSSELLERQSDLVACAREWSTQLPVTPDELTTAAAIVLEQDMMPEQPPANELAKREQMTRGDLVAILQATCGESADFWERRCSAGYAAEVLFHTVKAARADGKPLGTEPKIQAERALGYYCDKLEKGADNGPTH